MQVIENRQLWKLPKASPQPLYRQIHDLILEHIQSGRLKPGDLLPSYPWLSKTLGVADKTVRQALAELERAGVLDIQRGKGTFVAGGMAGAGAAAPRTGTVGILPPSFPVEVAQSHFFWRLIRALQEAALEQHLDSLLLAPAGGLGSPAWTTRVADRKKVDGLLVVSPGTEDAFLRRLTALPVPAVLVDAYAPGLPLDGVVFDNAGAARELTFKLIGLGHRKIGFLGIPRGQPAAEREAGYRHAMGSASLAVRPAWVAHADVDLGDSGAAAVDGLLDEKLTALVAFNGDLARTAARCALRRGLRVPQDLSLAATVGDGSWVLPGAEEQPLEALAFDSAELGRRAVRMLVERLAGKALEPRREVVAARHVPGTTSAPPP